MSTNLIWLGPIAAVEAKPGARSDHHDRKLGTHATVKRARRGPKAKAVGLVARLALGLLALALPAEATEIMTYKWDLDATTYTCPVVTARSVSRLVTTSGAASTTVTSVNSDAPFTGVAVGDAVVLPVVSATTAMRTGQEVRRVTAVASVDSITVDSNVTIPSAGGAFVWLDLATGTGAEDGWFAWAPTGDGELFVAIDQLNVTGGIDYKVEGRQCANAYCTPALQLATANLTAVGAARLATDKELVDQVRVCFKIGTADDGGDTGADAEQISITVRR